ncbi:MAG: hypothetical protein LBM78_03735 [Clostridiales bacterium]|jgi:hypothetical protein|nr:hypothetical protein [Clostridiales bacterium]
MFKGVSLAFFIVFAVLSAAQLVLMSPRLHMRLPPFCVQAWATLAALIPLAVLFPTVWGIAAAVVMTLYALGSTVHLLQGKTTVEQCVTGPKGPWPPM